MTSPNGNPVLDLSRGKGLFQQLRQVSNAKMMPAFCMKRAIKSTRGRCLGRKKSKGSETADTLVHFGDELGGSSCALVRCLDDLAGALVR
jgi:hypothetical protein